VTTTLSTPPTFTTRTSASDAALPIRRHEGIEVPAAGLWPLLTSSYVSRSSARGERQQLAITSGWLDLDVQPAASWMHLELADRAIDLTVTDIADDTHGLAAWHLAGRSVAGEQRDPVTMALRYHGVYRRGPEMWAWYSGSAVIGAPTRRRRTAGDRLSLDLLFAAS
jgi:hypothetical protein